MEGVDNVFFPGPISLVGGRGEPKEDRLMNLAGRAFSG